MRTDWAGWGITPIGILLFWMLTSQVRAPESPLWNFDKSVAAAAKHHAEEHPDLLEFAVTITDAGGVPVITALVIVGSLLLWMCGQSQLAALWILAAALGGAIDLSAKELIDRPRPDETLRDQAVTERNPSFPSGHAMGSTITYGTLGYVGFRLLRRRTAKFALAAMLTALVLVICASRVYLRAHWFSDVVGGAILGASWLALFIKIWERMGNSTSYGPS